MLLLLLLLWVGRKAKVGTHTHEGTEKIVEKDVPCHDQKRANRKKEELMQTGVLCLCCCLLAFRCCSAVVLITRSQSVHLSEIRRAMPCQTLPSLLHPVMDPVFFCVSSSPFPIHACLVSANSYAKNAAHHSFIRDKGKKKRQDAAAAVDEGSDAIHAPPCSKPNEKKRQKKPMVELSHAMQCDAFARCGSPQTCLP